MQGVASEAEYSSEYQFEYTIEHIEIGQRKKKHKPFHQQLK